ncbi:MAG: glycosyltransferase [Roseomonas sp.]|nr:glycosyltransferase [Roseomonas sp.]MCA3328026.1 glycosyltransferase [Roseomonas sp.]MCA3332881.1 glycosyltransferase [Roseomonas sp.]MCA3335044.1 glycosyltransferase [Roseomonas sp.]MCA3354862.1 glycosyltransferase [Roseomonas sp.]
MIWLAWGLGGFSLLITLGFLLLSIWHFRKLRRAGADRAGKVSLILALRGDQPGLAALFAALAAQEFSARRLIIAVETEADPAMAQARALAGMLPFPLLCVIAGEAEATAQKCANLAAAMALIDQHDDTVVVMDGDIRPQSYWLGCLVGPVLDGRYDIVTGYRWLQPGGAGWMVQAIAWLDHAVALLPRLKGIGAIWGGSTAYSAAALRQLDLPRLYARQLVDDLSAGLKARALGLRILTRRALLVPLPSASRGFAFYRRQFQYGWHYQPSAPTIALGVTTLHALGILVLLVASISGHGLAQLCLAMILLLRLACLRCHMAVAEKIASPMTGAEIWRQVVMALLPVVSVPMLLAIILSSVAARRMRWRDIAYDIAGPEELSVAWRRRYDDKIG